MDTINWHFLKFGYIFSKVMKNRGYKWNSPKLFLYIKFISNFYSFFFFFFDSIIFIVTLENKHLKCKLEGACEIVILSIKIMI
jgi:hypothetical protein